MGHLPDLWTAMATPDTSPCNAGESTAERTSDLCDELRIMSGEVALRAGENMSVVGACAVHSGVELLLREVSAEVVARWLEAAVGELRSSGRLGVPRAPAA